MKKLVKLCIIFIVAAVLTVSAVAVYILTDSEEEEVAQEEVFDRTPLDKASVFGDYVFESKIRDLLNIGEQAKINTADLENITDLDITSSGSGTTTDYCILSLAGLKYFPNLTRLVIDGNDVKSLSPLSYCKGLTSFSAVGCTLDDNDITPLTQLGGLTYLNIRNNEITDVSFLTGMPNLQILDISQTDITSDAVFKKGDFHNLKKLWIGVTNIETVENIANIKSLEYLDISGLELHDAELECLTKLKNLETLISEANIARDGSYFKRFEKLKVLDLYNNEISDLNTLNGCEKLEELNVGANMLYDLKGLENLKSLKKLTAHNNHIGVYTQLEQLPGLEYIKVDNNIYCKNTAE